MKEVKEQKEMQSNKVRKSLPLLILAVALTGTGLVCLKTFQPRPQKAPGPIEKLPYAFDFQAPTYTMRSLAFEGRFPKVPSKMMVYKIIHPHVTEAYVRQLAEEHFGMPGDAELKRSSGLSLYWLRSTDWELEVDPSNGTFSMWRMGRESSQTATDQRKYPSAEDCKRIAIEYLNKHNLLPGDAYLDRLVDNTKSSWGAMSVSFARNIRGYKSWGAGAGISVEIGPGGEVVAVLKQWQEIVPYREYDVKSPQEAFEELQEGIGVLMQGEKGTVKSITLRYYTSPQKQDYLQGVYYFDCAGPVHDFYGVVPAIRGEYLKSVEETLKEVEAQARQAKEKEAAEREEETERKRRMEESERITVTITERPAFASRGVFLAQYHDGTEMKTCAEDESGGPLVFRGVKKLGGELLVTYFAGRGSPYKGWAYIRQVSKRQITLPEEADIIVKRSEWIQIELALGAEEGERPARYKGFVFYPWKGARFGLFHVSMREPEEQGEASGQMKVALEAIPGEYYVRAIEEWPEEGVFLGKLTITGEAGRTYSLDLPAEEGP